MPRWKINERTTERKVNGLRRSNKRLVAHSIQRTTEESATGGINLCNPPSGDGGWDRFMQSTQQGWGLGVGSWDQRNPFASNIFVFFFLMLLSFPLLFLGPQPSRWCGRQLAIWLMIMERYVLRHHRLPAALQAAPTWSSTSGECLLSSTGTGSMDIVVCLFFLWHYYFRVDQIGSIIIKK